MRWVYVVTHPEATHHVERRVGGWYDSDLTDRGVDQAEAIGADLRARIPESMSPELFTSDLRRAHRTAEIVSHRLGVEPIVDANLREKSYGEAGGQPQAWLDERYIPLPEHGDRLRHDEGIPGAETVWDLAVRAYTAMDTILRSPASHQIIVTHGGTATFLLAAWIGMPIESAGLVHFRFTSGGISVLHQDDLYRSREVSELNTVDHLA